MLPHDELYHYGKKGMKWGIINEEELKGRPGVKEEAQYNQKFKKIRSDLQKKGLNEEGVRQKYGPDKPGVMDFVSRHKVAIALGVGGVALAGASLYMRPQYKSILANTRAYADTVDGLKLNWDKGVDLPSGSILKRVSATAETKVKPGGFFCAFRDDDVNAYKAIIPGFWTIWKNPETGKPYGSPMRGGYVNHYKALKRIKAPSGKESLDLFKSLSKIDPDFRTALFRDSVKAEDLDKIPEEIWREAFRQFSATWVAQPGQLPHVDTYFKGARSLGYNALIDFNDAGKLGRTPLRVIDDSIFVIIDNEKLSAKDIVSAAEHFAPELVHMLSDPNEMYHVGVKGMRWGVRKDDPVRLERKAGRQDQRAVKDQRRYERAAANPRVKPNKARYLEYKAEEHRRKAGRIRAKTLSPEEKTKALKTYNKFDRHNQYKKALKVKRALITGVGAYMLYPYLRMGVAIGGHFVIRNDVVKRNSRYAAEEAWRNRGKLPAVNQADLLKNAKAGIAYVIGEDGKLIPNGKFKIL